MHLGAKLTGIGYNVVHSGDMFYQNAVVNLQMLEAARLENVERYLCVSSACVYRRTAPVPTHEDEGFIDDPEPTNFGYGWSKRLAEVQARAYAMEYPLQIGIVRPYNAYGPRDDFDWDTSHVIPATIRKVLEHDKVVVWGDGSQLRTFVHARDLAHGMMLAIERHPQPDPINLSSDELVSIKDLVLTIRRLSGRDVPVEFDASKPSGQAVRMADLSKARQLIGYEPQVSLEEGLAETIDMVSRDENVGQITPGCCGRPTRAVCPTFSGQNLTMTLTTLIHPNPKRPDLPSPLPGWVDLVVLLAIVALATALRAYHLGYKSLWLDEVGLRALGSNGRAVWPLRPGQHLAPARLPVHHALDGQYQPRGVAAAPARADRQRAWHRRSLGPGPRPWSVESGPAGRLSCWPCRRCTWNMPKKPIATRFSAHSARSCCGRCIGLRSAV